MKDGRGGGLGARASATGNEHFSNAHGDFDSHWRLGSQAMREVRIDERPSGVLLVLLRQLPVKPAIQESLEGRHTRRPERLQDF